MVTTSFLESLEVVERCDLVKEIERQGTPGGEPRTKVLIVSSGVVE